MKIIFALAIAVSSAALGAKARTVHLSDTEMAPIRVSPGRSTILSFPIKPAKIILGSQGLFAVEYVENDLALAALQAPARSNLFVYLEGRRFAFDLTTVPNGGDEIVLVRDAAEKRAVRGKGKHHE